MAHLRIVDVIIVNWNTGQQLQECLASLSGSRRDGYIFGKVIVVDNASTDGSADGLNFPELPLSVIRNSCNRGFAAACNQGASGSNADYLLFLNPDTKVFADTLAKSVEFTDSSNNARAGILGVQLLDKDRSVSRTCARFPSTRGFIGKALGLNRLAPTIFPDHFYSEWDHLNSRPIEQVMGAYFFIRSSVFKQAEGFDERFFVYFEEVDLSLRALHAGWSTYYLATAQCYHQGGGSSKQIMARRLFYSLRSRILYGFKNFGIVSAIALLLATLFVEPVSRAAQAVFRASPRQLWETAHAYCLLWRELPRILGSRYLRTARVLKLDVGEV
jgi:N-acetylglucosaminyl-diphospho-decaprenol L-rhamnosyltransferase